MPIASYKPTVSSPTVNVTNIEPTNFESVVIDNDKIQIKALLAYISGKPWFTEGYYSQVLTKDSELRELDTSQSGVYQQYTEIKNLELRVESDLDQSYDEATSLSTVTGSATLYPFITPNVGDYIIARAGNNLKGLFRVHQASRKSYTKFTTWTIGYTLVAQGEQASALIENLKSKVNRSFIFSKERILDGLSPVLKSSDYATIQNLKKQVERLTRNYLKTFFIPEHSTLLIPAQSLLILDDYLVSFIMRFFPGECCEEFNKIYPVNPDNNIYLSQPQLFSILLEKDLSGLRQCNQKMGIADCQSFNYNSWLKGYRWKGIDYIVYPFEPDMSCDIKAMDRAPLALNENIKIEDSKSYKLAEFDYSKNIYETPTGPIKLIHSVTIDDYYVLSESFYKIRYESLSALELLTLDFLESKTIDLDLLKALVNAQPDWPRVEQFYYTPILILLMRAAVIGVYSYTT